jgi:hypothetical protein
LLPCEVLVMLQGVLTRRYLLHPWVSSRLEDYESIRPEAIWVLRFLHEKGVRDIVEDAMDALRRFFRRPAQSKAPMSCHLIYLTLTSGPHTHSTTGAKRRRSNGNASHISIGSDPSSPTSLPTYSLGPPRQTSPHNAASPSSFDKPSISHTDSTTSLAVDNIDIDRRRPSDELVRKLCPSLSEEVFQEKVI